MPKSWIKKKSYLFCWRVTGWRYKIEHTGENIVIASSMLRRAVREHQRCITQIIRDIITSNIHPPCLHEHVENIADVAPMCRRCVWDILNLGVPHWIFADCCALLGNVRRYIDDGSWRRNIGRKFQWHFCRCPDALAKHGDYSHTSPIIRRNTGAAQIWKEAVTADFLCTTVSLVTLPGKGKQSWLLSWKVSSY